MDCLMCTGIPHVFICQLQRPSQRLFCEYNKCHSGPGWAVSWQSSCLSSNNIFKLLRLGLAGGNILCTKYIVLALLHLLIYVHILGKYCLYINGTNRLFAYTRYGHRSLSSRGMSGGAFNKKSGEWDWRNGLFGIMLWNNDARGSM